MAMKTGRHNAWLKTLLVWLPLMTLGLAGTIAASVSVGSADVTFLTVWKVILSHLPFAGDYIQKDWNQATDVIIWNIRMPRIFLGILVGAALSGAGVAYQGVLRNPLADPYILGVSSGASLGAAIVMMLGWQASLLGQWTLPTVAFACGMVTLFAVYRLAQVQNRIRIDMIILSGVVVQAFIAAALSFILAMSDEKMQSIMYWLMGSLSLSDWSYGWVMFPYVTVGIAVIWLFVHKLNALALGEEAAHHLGVPVERVKLVVLISASIVTGAAVSVSGTIGFVGLIIPHTVRLLLGTDHRVLFPVSVLAGAIFLVGADTIARMVLEPRELPIGIITAFMGAPFFAYLLRKKKMDMFS